MKHTPQVLDRIHQPHPLYQACSLADIIGVGITALILVVPLSAGISAQWLGLPMVGVIVALPLTYGVTWLALKRLSAFKEGKPKGYLKQWLHYQAHRAHLGRCVRITRNGHWSIRP